MSRKQDHDQLSSENVYLPFSGKLRSDLKIGCADSAMRDGTTGNFGTVKRKYRMNPVMAKLQNTIDTSIAMIVLVMNLEKILRDIFIFIKGHLQVLLNRKNLNE